MKNLFVLALVLFVLATAASAQGPRERFQRNRLRESVRSGELTRVERLDLRKDQFRYNRMERMSSRDGVVIPKERKKLRKAKAENRRERFRFMHNRKRRVI